MKRSCLVVFLGVVLLCWSSSLVFACECKGQSITELERSSDLVAHGKISLYEEVQGNTWHAHLRVGKVYKGSTTAGSTVVIENTPGKCGARIRAGRTFMVYAKKKGTRYITSSCMKTRAMKQAPIAPGIYSILPKPVGKGSLADRVALASDVLVVQVKKTGTAFAGSWQGVALEAKIKQSFRGKKRGKIKLQVDQKSCQKRKRILSEDEVDGALEKSLFKKGQSYLVFTFGEDPALVSPCHDNIVPLAKAKDTITALKTMCKKGACRTMGSSTFKVSTMRKTMRKEISSKARATIALCHKQHVKKGVVTDIKYHVAVKADGAAVVRKVNSSGTVEQGSVYDAVVKCLIDTTQKKWALTPYEGVMIRAKMTFKLSPKHPKRLKFVSEQITFQRDRR